MMQGGAFVHRPLVPVALCAGAGVVLGVYAPYHPAVLLAGVLLGALLALILKKTGRRAAAGLCAAAFFLFAFLSGFSVNGALPRPDTYQVCGVVTDDAKAGENGHISVYLRDVRLTDAAGVQRQIPGAYWTYYAKTDAEETPKAGQTAAFTARLYHPAGQTNPYGFDFRLFLLERNVTAGLYGNDGCVLSDTRQLDAHYAAILIRAALAARLDTIFAEESALPKALLLGERDDLPEKMREAFSRVGIAHVLAVSGLHVGLLAGALALALKRFVYPKARAWIVGAFLLFYCFLLDFSAPVVRASIIMAGALFDKARGRSSDPLSALALSFLLILFVQPLDLLSSGFILSFSAVLGMILLNDFFRFPFIRWHRLRTALSATCSASVGTAVPCALIFHRLSLIGLMVSPAFCIALSVLLPAYALTLAAGCASQTIGMALGSVLGPITGYLQRAIVFLSELDFASFRVPDIPFALIPAVVCVPFFLSPYASMSRKKRAVVFLALVVCGSALHLFSIDRGVSYTQLDMGAADCALIEDGRTTVVVDAGEDGSELCEYLLSTGRTVDTLFLTHLHADHCLGVNELLDEEIPIGRVVLGQGADRQIVSEECRAVIARLKEKNVPVAQAAAGDTFSFGRVHLTVLWPAMGAVRANQDPNDYSMALYCDLNGVSCLLAGDLTGAYDAYAACGADILKVAHHGGANDTSAAFLKAVSPRAAIVSANRTGASEKTLARLDAEGADIYVTGVSGAIRVEAINGGFRIIPYLFSEAAQ